MVSLTAGAVSWKRGLLFYTRSCCIFEGLSILVWVLQLSVVSCRLLVLTVGGKLYVVVSDRNLLLVIGCRLPNADYWLLGVGVEGRFLVVGCWLLIIGVRCRSLFYCRCPALGYENGTQKHAVGKIPLKTTGFVTEKIRFCYYNELMSGWQRFKGELAEPELNLPLFAHQNIHS